MPKVLITDNIASEGIELLQKNVPTDIKRGLTPEELVDIIGDYDALVVRSETKVTSPVIEAGRNLKVVARAGIGVDNIDLDAATRAGIAVVNAPIGNTVAAAEHTLALMLSLARNVPQAYASMKEGQWQRSAFMGIEVRNKTLGIIGLGRVGSEVARRASSFGMRLIAFDPFVAPDFAARLGVTTMTLDELLPQADFITLHTPLTPGTTKMINKEQLAKMKPGARLINVARGELVDEDALLQALENEQLAGVALDVFTNEPPGDLPLLRHPRLMATPHLGASTQEAQREVAIEAAEQVIAVLNGQPARNTVNAPFVPPEVHAILAPYVPVASMVGRLLTNMARGQFIGVTLRYQGEIATHNTAILKAAALVGLLSPVSGEVVNMINAPVLAQQRGLQITEQTSSDGLEYASLISATLHTTGDDITIAGTSLRDEPHLVRVNDYWMDVAPSTPYLLFVDNQDQPGTIGAVGTVAGRRNINISFMEVGRIAPRGQAMMVLGVDDPISADALDEIMALPQIDNARVVAM
ncbi:D-3-phosphoglycerate dehydrogenase [Geodia barretti]|uniref:D-3-phosphoglycerate dehydrogenase n=1 Tax=Geodia barretti TaxID=519541 RepID=A0AA35T0L5_GEOBA|nr:D-3-phosphoglycerate dehydrogenase [Geodia barretti]